MELLSQTDILNGFARIDLRAGNYRGLLLVVNGVNGAGLTAALADLGNVKLQHQAYGERINTPFYFWSERTNLLGGVVDNASAAGLAFRFSAILSFRRKFDNKNILVVRSDVKTTLSWDGFGANIAGAASGTISIYGLYDNKGVARYIPNVRTQQSTAAAAITIKEQIPFPFVEELWGETDANITRVQILRDGMISHDGLWADLVSLSNAQNEVETAIGTTDMTTPVGDVPASVSQTTFQIITAAALIGGVFTFHYFVCDPVAPRGR